MENIKQGAQSPQNLVIAWILTLVIMFGFMVYGLPYVLDQHEKELQWKAERLCQQGYYCNPKRGA